MTPADWTQAVEQMIRRHQAKGGFIVVFPEFRPDQFLALARHLEIHPFDYRKEVMSDYGWDADKLTLEDLDRNLREQSVARGTLVNNVEALLATKHADDCAHWIARFLDQDWVHAIVIPVVINAQLTPFPHPRVHRISDDALPDQTLINRLSF